MTEQSAVIVDYCSQCGNEIYEHEAYYSLNGKTVCIVCEHWMTKTKEQKQEGIAHGIT